MLLSLQFFNFFKIVALRSNNLLLLLEELVPHIVFLGAEDLLVLAFLQNTHCVEHIQTVINAAPQVFLLIFKLPIFGSGVLGTTHRRSRGLVLTGLRVG